MQFENLDSQLLSQLYHRFLQCSENPNKDERYVEQNAVRIQFFRELLLPYNLSIYPIDILYQQLVPMSTYPNPDGLFHVDKVSIFDFLEYIYSTILYDSYKDTFERLERSEMIQHQNLFQQIWKTEQFKYDQYQKWIQEFEQTGTVTDWRYSNIVERCHQYSNLPYEDILDNIQSMIHSNLQKVRMDQERLVIYVREKYPFLDVFQ